MTTETAVMATASDIKPKRWPKHAVWIGLTIAAGNFLLYAFIIPISPNLRDDPWINIPLSWLGLALAATGAWFVFKQGGGAWRKGLAASALVLTFFLVGLFNWYVFSFSYSLPESAEATATQAVAPDFSLRDHNNRDVNLSDYSGNKVVLIFYRGDW